MAETAKNCACCGAPISKRNAWLLPQRFGGGLVPYCNTCMGKWYRQYATIFGYKLALFFCCAMFNLPYKPHLLAEAKERATAQKKNELCAYIDTLRARDLDGVKIKGEEFLDGVTDINKAFGGEYATLEIDDEMLNAEDYKNGRVNQVKDWGIGPAKRPYDQNDYDKLDEYYAAFTNGRPNITPQTDLAIKTVCVMQLERQYCLDNGEYGEAKKLGDMIKAEMEGEQLRKKDELPQDRVRLDDIVSACERAGLLEKSYDDLVDILSKKLFHTKYGYTRDAADQMLLYIVNATRFNEGYAELDRLPDDFAMQDPLGEFAEEPDELEKQTYKELQIAPLQMRAGE
jgi:hypothetical protein